LPRKTGVPAEDTPSGRPGRRKPSPTGADAPAPRRRRGTPAPEVVDALPLLPIRNEVYFPHMIFPLLVGREKSVRALDDAAEGGRCLVIVTQNNASAEDPGPEDIYKVGIVAEIMQILRVPDGTVRVMLEGLSRCRILGYEQTEPHLVARVEKINAEEVKDLQTEALMRSVCAQFEQIVNAGKAIQPEALVNVMNTEQPGRLADVITPYLRQLKFETQQEILETIDVRDRLEMLAIVLRKESELVDIQRTIRARVEKEMGDTQREYLLREQMKVIQSELGEKDDLVSEVADYRDKIARSGMPEASAERVLKEVKRFEKLPPASPEMGIVRNYLDTILALPWNSRTEDRLDLAEAEKILNADHYGLDKVKDRILEFLAVRALTGGGNKGSILCFQGPPGVGKTSLGRSIASALGRKFVHVSVGGMKDEAEIRGHRRTYIGALPGRILQGLKTCGSRNPVFVLDEIDKINSDFRGDPSSALLEALDPEQNFEFSDHFLEIPFDLSEVLFLTTANLLEPIPPALRDRMEVISFSSYTEEEKLQIAREHLVPRQLKDHGLADKAAVTITDEALTDLITNYTREAGIRGLEREIGAICRKLARKYLVSPTDTIVVDVAALQDLLGKPRFHRNEKEKTDQVGAATGLVYTEVGGDIISIEVSLIPSRDNKVQLTGRLGDVMKESAQTALSYLRGAAESYGISSEKLEHHDLHLHVPAGAIPKDGPSAGISICSALLSALRGSPIRHDTALTGEITLRGHVLAVGGIKEKLIAAHRAGIYRIIIPAENLPDLDDLPQSVRSDLDIHLVTEMTEVAELIMRQA
jgi:ATP-dependent Lon protease